MAQIGIDASKVKLDACWLRDVATLRVKTRRFDNTPRDHEHLAQWLIKQTGQAPESIQVMMEATGIYHESVAYALYERGFEVYVVNPAHARAFANSLGRRSKTDKKDSVMLARFLATGHHRVWTPEPPEVRRLKALLARLEALDKDIQREHNRQEKAEIQGVSERVLASIERVLQTLTAERQRLLRDIDDHIDGHPHLKQDRQLLETIPGISKVLSRELLAMIRSRPFTKAGECAAFAGLIPICHQSGTSVDGPPRLSKAGAGRLRAKLYMAATVAIRHNPDIRAHYQRLLRRGKVPMSALGGAMRKLVQIAYGVLKHQTGYRPQVAT